MDIDEGQLLLPIIIAGTLPYLAFALLGKRSAPARAFGAILCIVFALRYVWWRWTYSIPTDQSALQEAWVWIFLGFETMSNISSIMVYVFMSRTRSRSAVVDARPHSALLRAPVDVFIVTYNEQREILERTIVGALNIDHADLRVWVLDDGARPWVCDLARSLNVHYTFRVKGRHAKAGNVNHGLEVACATGRRPEFMLLLDADFVPSAHILRRTLPLFEEADVGIVQTPQHFFNPDPIQSNLMCAKAWPDEQRFFFNHLLASKDAWGAAFCCGTSAVFRLAVLEACGGMATETVTEDTLTTFRMLEHGYRTVFLNEQLSLGLAPEGLQEFIPQRSRWCLGAMQQIYTRWSFAGPARIGLVNRLSSFDVTLFWIFGFSFKLMMVSAPLVYWWTGTSVINSSANDMLFWLGPYMLSGIMFMGSLAANTVFPIITDVTQLLSAFAIVRTVATALVKPFGHPFKVTAKGLSTEGMTIQWAFLMPFLLLAGGTALGMGMNLSSYSTLNGTDGYNMNVIWSVFNITVLCIAAAICVELPRRRRDERFPADEPASLAFGKTSGICTVRNISLGGAALERPDGWAQRGRFGTILLRGVPEPIPFEALSENADGILAIRFRNSDEVRYGLIRKLFTGLYNNEVPKVRLSRVSVSVLRKLFD
jgi:cellulose synthase (UDP-forming)